MDNTDKETEDKQGTLIMTPGPGHQTSKDSAFQVQSTLKNLQNNYQSVENAIVAQTNKQQQA